MEVGTLKELDVKPGDVVQAIGEKTWEIVGIDESGNYLINDHPSRHLSNSARFHIISRASNDKPKTWGKMTDAEKGALLLAVHEGKVVEDIDTLSKYDTWERCWNVGEFDDFAYRIRPELKRDTVTMEGGCFGGVWRMSQTGFICAHTHRITFNTIDGEPDCNSIKMDKIK